MKKLKRGKILLLCALMLFLSCALLFSGRTAAKAEGAYTFNLAAYDVVYDVNSNCTIQVSETITVNFTGYASTGFIRDIPVNNGARAEDIEVSQINYGTEYYVDYTVYTSGSYICVDIGDTSHKSGNYTYLLTYKYVVSSTDGALYLNPIGTGWDCDIYNATVTVNLPDGFISGDTKCYYGASGSSDTLAFSVSGNTVTTSVSHLSAGEGVTFNFFFEDGALSSYVDFTPWLLLLILVAVLVALIVAKFMFFRNPILTPVVNFTPPDDMDPLAMGQLIDGSVNDEDITSLIYYWADKGYLKINLENEKDPVLIRVYKQLPAGSPNYQQIMFNDIFKRGDSVKISELSKNFYPTVEKVRSMANKNKRSMYSSASITASLAFALISSLLFASLPLMLVLMRVSYTMFNLTYFIAAVPAMIVFLLTQALYYYRHKLSKKKIILLAGAIVLLGAVLIALYALIIPSSIYETAPKVIGGIITLAIVMLSATLLTRTEKYNGQLNQIIGFRNFIVFTEKDKLEAMLEEDPQLYYHVLPYAQVLGVTDKWEKQFASLTVEPPKWMANPVGTYVQFAVINACIRTSFMTMSRNIAIRSAPKGASGIGGIISGGFSGGGFGGGGGRGR